MKLVAVHQVRQLQDLLQVVPCCSHSKAERENSWHRCSCAQHTVVEDCFVHQLRHIHVPQPTRLPGRWLFLNMLRNKDISENNNWANGQFGSLLLAGDGNVEVIGPHSVETAESSQCRRPVRVQQPAAHTGAAQMDRFAVPPPQHHHYHQHAPSPPSLPRSLARPLGGSRLLCALQNGVQ